MPAPASTLDFNRELLFGEVGALLAANPVASLVARFTSNPGVISGAAVAGTLAGGVSPANKSSCVPERNRI